MFGWHQIWFNLAFICKKFQSMTFKFIGLCFICDSVFKQTTICTNVSSDIMQKALWNLVQHAKKHVSMILHTHVEIVHWINTFFTISFLNFTQFKSLSRTCAKISNLLIQLCCAVVYLFFFLHKTKITFLQSHLHCWYEDVQSYFFFYFVLLTLISFCWFLCISNFNVFTVWVTYIKQ